VSKKADPNPYGPSPGYKVPPYTPDDQPHIEYDKVKPDDTNHRYYNAGDRNPETPKKEGPNDAKKPEEKKAAAAALS